EEARDAAGQMASLDLDLLVLFQATFADSTMVMQITDIIDVPLLLWAVPEERTGGRLRLNSLTGINLAGHALKREGRSYEYLYAAPDDPAALDTVRSVAAAARAYWTLRGARIGRVGEHPDGFDTCAFDYERVAARFGVEVVPLDLRDEFCPLAQAGEAGAGDNKLVWLRGGLGGRERLYKTAVM